MQVLEPLYLSPPFTLKNWKEISKGYEDLRQFPHILAEHSMKEDVQIEATAKTGSLCRIFSGVAFLAICDAKYTFNAVSVG